MGCACYSSKDKIPKELDPPGPQITPIAQKGTKNYNEQLLIMRILEDDIGISKLYCQQIYDVFRPKILMLKVKRPEEVNLDSHEFI